MSVLTRPWVRFTTRYIYNINIVNNQPGAADDIAAAFQKAGLFSHDSTDLLATLLTSCTDDKSCGCRHDNIVTVSEPEMIEIISITTLLSNSGCAPVGAMDDYLYALTRRTRAHAHVLASEAVVCDDVVFVYNSCQCWMNLMSKCSSLLCLFFSIFCLFIRCMLVVHKS